MKRRTFLHNLGGMFAGAMLSNNIIFGRENFKFGLQLYTVRKNMAVNADETLRRVSALGIKEVEFAGYFNHTPAQIRELLRKYGLTAPAAHIDIDTLRGNPRKTIEDAAVIGHKYLVLPYLPANERKTLDDYKRVAELLDSAGIECRKSGLQLAYHNHDFEFEAIEGKLPFDLILGETDQRNVKIEMDLYWITKAGFDTLNYFEKYPKRFSLVHVKDMDNTPKKSFTEIGRGVIDFKKIFSKAGKAGIKHFFIEQDVTPGDPLNSVKISLEYLQALKF